MILNMSLLISLIYTDKMDVFSDFISKFNNIDFTSTQSIVFGIIVLVVVLIVLIRYETKLSYYRSFFTPNIMGTLNYIHDKSQNVTRSNSTSNRREILSNLINKDAENITLEKNDLIFMLDPYGNFLYANDKTLILFNKKLEEILGESLLSEFKKLGLSDNKWYDELRLNQESFNIVKFDYQNEEKLIFMSYHANLDELNNIESIIVAGSDMTNLVKLDPIKDYYQKKDQITGLMNQYGMFEKLREMKSAESAICFSIDAIHFSDMTGYYGHHITDELSIKIAEDLKVIAGKDGYVARYTESKFILMFFNGPVDDLRIRNYTDKIIDFLYKPYRIKNIDLQVDRKVGCSVYPTDSKNLDEIISLSSIALSDAINHNNIEINRYDKSMMENLKYNLELANKLKLALDNEVIQVYFQKAIDCSNNTTYVVEELARWKDEELGYVSPLDFFKIAKETNQLDRLDKYMVEKSLLKFKALKETNEEVKEAKLTVNLSPTSLLNLNFFAFFDQKVNEIGLNPSDIFIEISEGTFVNKLDLCVSRINNYKRKGYLIALDDFGIEYSSLAVLEKVNYDVIKLDQHFVKNIHNPSNREIIKMIRKISELKNKEVIAEGVETKEVCDLLQSLGCNIQQGYYLHKPENITL